MVVLGVFCAVTVVGMIVAYLWVNNSFDETAEELRQLEEARAVLEVERQDAERQYADALLDLDRVKREESDKREVLAGKTEWLLDENRALKSEVRRLVDLAETEVAELPLFDDVELQTRALEIYFPIANSATVELTAPDTYQVNRPYLEASLVQAIEAKRLGTIGALQKTQIDALEKALSFKDAEITSWVFQYDTLEVTHEQCRSGLETYRALEANNAQRLEAQAKQLKNYEKKLRMERIKGWTKAVAGVAAGYLVGRTL